MDLPSWDDVQQMCAGLSGASADLAAPALPQY
jgi:hypothetical protein